MRYSRCMNQSDIKARLVVPGFALAPFCEKYGLPRRTMLNIKLGKGVATVGTLLRAEQAFIQYDKQQRRKAKKEQA